MKIILASVSPRRKELLSRIIEEFEIIPSTFDETIIKETEKTPAKLVEKLSVSKAEDIFNKDEVKNSNEDVIVIGGDTVVYFDNEIMGKPEDEKEAFSMLQKIQGKTNEVYSGLCVIMKIGNEIVKEVTSTKTSVKFKNMSNQDINEYIATKEPLDKAGSYGVQGAGAKYIEKIEGSYSSVVGLDIEKLEKILKEYL